MQALRSVFLALGAMIAFGLLLGLGGIFAFGIITLSSHGFWYMVLGTVVIATPVLGGLYLWIQISVADENPSAAVPIIIYSGAVLETSVHLVTVNHHWSLWVAVPLGLLATALSVTVVVRSGAHGASEALGWSNRMQ